MHAELFPDEGDVDSTDVDRELVEVLRLNIVPGLGPRTYQLLLELSVRRMAS